MPLRRYTVLLLTAVFALPACGTDFTKEVAPIFESHCIRCHNADQKKGKFSLATREAFFAGGKEGVSVVAHHADRSRLIEMVTARGGEKAEMPEEGPPLSGEEVSTLRRWIDEGAVWPAGVVITAKAKADKGWWSLQKLSDAAAPSPRDIPAAWGASPIDRFVFAKLAEKGLQPSAPASWRELVRRATYDLTGLPPTPEEVAAFVADASPTAYEALIDRLLASPRYGEHWGRHWLDVVRFGESTGFERNIIRDNAWPFRDYVIRSLNDDKPFDRFIVEHLAGDQIGNGDPTVDVGTGFLVAGPYDDVGNQDAKAAAQIRANTIDDVISATGSAFLGLTLNCARCHDHKFDPIPQADYYRVQSAFWGVQQGPRELATAEQRRELAAKAGPVKQALAEVNREVAALNAEAAKRVKEHRAELLTKFPRPPVSVRGNEERIDEPVRARFVRMTFPRRAAGAAVVIMSCEVWTAGASARNVALVSEGATVSAVGTRQSDVNPDAYSPTRLIDGDADTGWIGLGSGDQPPKFTIQLADEQSIARVFWAQDHNSSRKIALVSDYTVEVSLDGEHWRRVADQADRLPPTPPQVQAALTNAALEPGERERLDALNRRKAQLDMEIAALPKLPTAWVGTFKQPTAVTYLMTGGDPQKHGPDVVPASLAVLDQVTQPYTLAPDAPEGQRRLTLAQWIVSDQNPLTPRVLANRLWHYHFGTGIVDTPGDFGYMGGRPTHPELLDHLARRLKENGWRIKAIHREIMLSQAYRQSATWRKEAADVDHDGRLLWRFPPHRLTAEELRDSMLSVAGVLDLTRAGGPGFRLYAYHNDNVSTYVPLDRPGPETYRRAVYHQNARAASVDLLAEFDLPDCAFTAPRRSSTTTPLQALTLLNHAFTLDMAEALAKRLDRECGPSADSGARVKRAFALAFGREATIEEVRAGEKLIALHGLNAFCRAIFNANEMIYVY